MSILQLSAELSIRDAYNLHPKNLPIEMLISFIRELTMFLDNSLTNKEKEKLRVFLCNYIEKLLELHPPEQLHQFQKNPINFLPLLILELEAFFRDEIVSRLIGYSTHRSNLAEDFARHFFISEAV